MGSRLQLQRNWNRTRFLPSSSLPALLQLALAFQPTNHPLLWELLSFLSSPFFLTCCKFRGITTQQVLHPAFSCTKSRLLRHTAPSNRHIFSHPRSQLHRRAAYTYIVILGQKRKRSPVADFGTTRSALSAISLYESTSRYLALNPLAFQPAHHLIPVPWPCLACPACTAAVYYSAILSPKGGNNWRHSCSATLLS